MLSAPATSTARSRAAPATAHADGLRKAAQVAATIAAALLALAASRMPSMAEPVHTLIVPASDGYDFEDCLATNKACGHVIADAWCEAHGLSAALSFGRSEDVTASIATAGSPQSKATPAAATMEPGSFIVNCKG